MKGFGFFAKRALLTLALIAITGAAMAQSEVDELISEIAMLKGRLDTLDMERAEDKKSSFYTPRLDGSIVSYFQYNPDTQEERFGVRNAQVAVRGYASKNIYYVIQVNFHNLAKVSVLDTYIRYKYKGFDTTIGQQWIHLTSDFDRCGPKANLFTSRSYGVVFIPTYTTDTAVTSLGNRDIGLYTNYKFAWKVPLTLSLGLFNGLGSNNLAWDSRVNVTGRVQIGDATGLSAGASVYSGTTAIGQDITIWSGETKYAKGNLFLEANYQQRRLREGSAAPLQMAQTALVQGYYTFKTPNSRLFDSFAPTVRYDLGRDIDFLNLSSNLPDQLNVNRITAVINFMLKGTKIKSRFSIGYEETIMPSKPSDFEDNPLFQDRLTVSMTVAF